MSLQSTKIKYKDPSPPLVVYIIFPPVKWCDSDANEIQFNLHFLF